MDPPLQIHCISVPHTFHKVAIFRHKHFRHEAPHCFPTDEGSALKISIRIQNCQDVISDCLELTQC